MKHTFFVLALALLSQTAHAFPSYINGGFRGANLMTSEEIHAHVAKLLSVKTFTECEDYMNAHEAELQKRALQRHVSLPPRSGDPCKVMRFFGRIE